MHAKFTGTIVLHAKKALHLVTVERFDSMNISYYPSCISWLYSHFWSMIWVSASALTFFLTHAFMRYFQCQCFLHSTIDVCKSMGILLDCAIESVFAFSLQKITSKMYRSMTHIYLEGTYCFRYFFQYQFCFRQTGMKSSLSFDEVN